MNLSDEELLKYSKDHISYEIEMLVLSSEFRPLVIPLEQQQTFINMRIESFVIHLRNLIDFLYPSKKTKDDVLAEHYFEEAGDWKQIRPLLPESLRKARELAHKKLLHLTVRRFIKDEWDTGYLVAEIEPVLRRFYESANESKLHKKGLFFLTHT